MEPKFSFRRYSEGAGRGLRMRLAFAAVEGAEQRALPEVGAQGGPGPGGRHKTGVE